VGARYFEHKARRAWWATHLEAWRRSGVSRTEYCRLHRLTKSTFDRWLGALNSLESAREEARKRRKRTREPLSTDKRNKAVQAFWAMHVEALNWSGVPKITPRYTTSRSTACARGARDWMRRPCRSTGVRAFIRVSARP
jgi:hypothetical protein